VVAVVILLVGLLIEGCMSEQTTDPAPGQKGHPINGVPASWTNPALMEQQKPKPVPHRILTQPVRPPQSFSKENVATACPPETLYVVKSGDSLTRIAKAHGTTVKALKAANGWRTTALLSAPN